MGDIVRPHLSSASVRDRRTWGPTLRWALFRGSGKPAPRGPQAQGRRRGPGDDPTDLRPPGPIVHHPLTQGPNLRPSRGARGAWQTARALRRSGRPVAEDP